nr:hypothetical protein [Tanacetum cinerariifolium]
MNSPPNHGREEGPYVDDSDLRLTPIVRPGNNPHIVPEITTTTQSLISSQNHQVDTYDKCEQAVDIDDSDLRVTPVVRPSNNPHIVPEITTSTQTMFSSQNNQDDNCVVKHVRIIPGPVGIVQTVKLRKLANTREGGEESLNVLDDVNVDGRIMTGCFGDVKKFLKSGKLEKVVAVIKSGTLNALGDLTVTLKDLLVSGTIHYKILTEERFAKVITVGADLILHNVSIFSTKQSTHHYLNITKKYMVKVFHKDDGSTKFQCSVLNVANSICLLWHVLVTQKSFFELLYTNC